MTHLNQFSVNIREGYENNSGHVELKHGKQYTLTLANRWWKKRCSAEVHIDGKLIGTFIIPANDRIVLERPPGDTGCFTFYRAGSKKARQAGLPVSSPDLGLITVIFTPEFQLEDVVYPVNIRRMADSGGQVHTNSVCHSVRSDYNAGGTGLSGNSDQEFVTASAPCLDYSLTTTIHLRLVESKSKNSRKDPRPLQPVSRSTPIPPPVNGNG